MSEESTTLGEISAKLDALIAITKLANRETIRKVREEIEKDPVSSKILAIADGSLASNDFKQKVIAETRVSKATVERRIASLVDLGVIAARKKWREIYYENSGLLG